MNIWIVNPYGTLPSEGWREYRSSMLARALADSGNEVTWWLSNFEHRSKKFRPSGLLKEGLLPDAVQIYSVPSSAYTSNISLARIKYELTFGRNFGKYANSFTPPDVIILAEPSLFFSSPVVRYSDKVGAKIILDVLDLWPEQFQVALPRILKSIGRFLFFPLYQRRQRLVKRADGVVGVTKDHLKAVNVPVATPKLVAYLGLNYARFVSESSRDPPIELRRFVQNSDLVVIYAGTLGEAYDIDSVMQAAENVVQANNRVKFIFAGEGPYKNKIQGRIENYPANMLFVGKVPSEDLPAIYNICQVGICSYSKDSTVTMPVKLYDYLAGGLYVAYSISGEIDQLLKHNSCGSKYTAESPDELSRMILSLVYVLDSKSIYKKCTELARSFDEDVQHQLVAEFIEKLAGTDQHLLIKKTLRNNLS
jgi:glycosyltransferase involved in cell wall biosynthesis